MECFRGKIAVFFICLFFLSCSKPEDPHKENQLRFNLITEPPSLDWNITTDSSSIQVINNIMEGLYKYDKNLNLVPAIAERMEVLDGGFRYRFYIRDNARWSDGVRVIAEHFVDSWRRAIDPQTAAEYAYFLYPVKNAQAINSGSIKDISKLSVKAVGNDILEVELEKPIVFFPYLTTFMVTYPIRKEIIEKNPDSWTEPENIVTNGPYKLVEWHHEYKLVLTPNPYYYGEKPKLDRVVIYTINEQVTALSLYETGALDFLFNMPAPSIPYYKNSPEYHRYPYIAVYYLGFNVLKPPVDNVLVRRALAMAIDKEKIPQILKGGQIPANSYLPPGILGHNPELGLKFNPEKARKLLEEAGYPSGKNFPEITLSFNSLEDNQLICEFVQEQWQKNLGIKVYLRNMEWKVYLKELQYSAPQVWRLGWIADYPDPDTFLTVFLSESGNNHTSWKSKEYDELVERASLETDEKKRKELCDHAQKLLLEEATAIIPLYFYAQNWLIKPYVKGLEINPMELLYLDSVWIDHRLAKGK